jgi:exonuclease III
VGYWSADGISKRIDGFRASGPVAAATTAVEVADSEEARAISDHLPVVCKIDVANIGVWEARRAQGK